MLATSASCVQDQEFLIIDNVVPLAEDCTISPSASGTYTQQIADVYFRGAIVLGVSVTNHAVPNGNSNTNLDDSEIMLESAEVTLSFSGGGVAGGAFEQPIPTLSLFGGETASIGLTIPSDVVDSLNATMAGLGPNSFETLTVDVVIKGRKAGEISPGTGKLGAVESRTFSFPVDICYQCLADCSLCPNMECPGSQAEDWSGGVCGTPMAPAAPNCQ